LKSSWVNKYESIGYDKKDLAQPWFDLNPALKKVNEMEDQGWELFDTGIAGLNGSQFVYYFRRKEQ